MKFPVAPRVLGFVAMLGLAYLTPTARAATEELPQFRSVLIDGQSRLFSLADNTGAGRWLSLGEDFDGWKLEAYDATKQTLTVTRDGAKQELALASGRIAAGAADAKASVADADALLQKMRFEDMVTQSVEAQQKAMAKSMGGLFGGAGATPEEQAKFADFQQKLMKAMFEEMDLPGMRQDLAKVMADIYTPSELKAQADFYSTAAGQAVLDKQPALQTRMTELMMPRMMKAMPRIQALSAEFAKDLKAAKKAPTAPTSSPAPAPAPAATPAPTPTPAPAPAAAP